MSIYSTQPLTFGSLHTYPLASRKSKVGVRDFGKAPANNASIAKFLDSLPTHPEPTPEPSKKKTSSRKP